MESTIDPPVGPYSDPKEIKDWILELERMSPPAGSTERLAVQSEQGKRG